MLKIGRSYKPASTKAIIIFGFASVFVLMIAVIWVSLSTIQSVNSRMGSLIQVTDRKSSTAHQMRDAVRSRSSKMTALAATDSAEKHEIIFTHIANTTDTYLEGRQNLAALGSGEEETTILQKLNDADARINASYAQVYNHFFDIPRNTKALESALQDTKLQELVLLNHLNDLVQLEKKIAREQLELSQKQYSKTRQTLVLISAVAVLFGILISALVTSRVSRANSRIAHLASHDDLTGLINRREFESQLLIAIERASSSTSVYGLMYVDLDRFKIVNDTCGHHAGDQLLIELTTMVRNGMGENNKFARIGGDEFAIIARATSFSEITRLAESLRVMVHDYTFKYANQEFKVSLSIGVIPLRGNETDLETVLTHVDSACYIAKQSGRNRVHVAPQNDENIVKYRNDIAGIQLIRHALSEDQMVLFYQPVYSIANGTTVMEHCEVLLRIVNETGDLMSPAEFIPLAEKYNIMTEIDRWVLYHVTEWVKQHQDDYELPRLLVNLSGLSLIDREFLDYAVTLLKGSGINCRRLAFEITETSAVDNLELAREFMGRLRALGCRFALDDFGSGFSTFAYLKGLPIDYLKIDGSLVRDMAVDTVDLEMVKAINQVGHVVGAKTIAEFVEDDTILNLLRELGVDYAQGFGLQRPRELALLIADLAKIQRAPKFKKAS